MQRSSNAVQRVRGRIHGSRGDHIPPCDIVDADDFPDGNYELEFDGHKVLFTKKGEHYLARLVDCDTLPR